MNFLKYLIVFVFIALGATDIFCQPGPPGGMGMGGPPCWPPSTCDPSIPLNNELIFLLIAGLGLGIYFFKKEKSVAASS